MKKHILLLTLISLCSLAPQQSASAKTSDTAMMVIGAVLGAGGGFGTYYFNNQGKNSTDELAMVNEYAERLEELNAAGEELSETEAAEKQEILDYFEEQLDSKRITSEKINDLLEELEGNESYYNTLKWASLGTSVLGGLLAGWGFLRYRKHKRIAEAIAKANAKWYNDNFGPNSSFGRAFAKRKPFGTTRKRVRDALNKANERSGNRTEPNLRGESPFDFPGGLFSGEDPFGPDFDERMANTRRVTDEVRDRFANDPFFNRRD